MPNYCENKLYIRGSEVPEVLKAIGAGDGRAIDFETIIPLPEPFCMRSGGINDLAILCATKPEDDLGKYAAYPWVAGADVKTQSDLCRLHGTTREEMVQRGRQALDNFDNYAGGGLCEMCERLWGTKWNAIDPGLLKSSDDSQATIEFETAWSPPLPVIVALGNRFPGNNFKLTYIFAGELIVQGVLEIQQAVITVDDYRETADFREGEDGTYTPQWIDNWRPRLARP